MSPVAGAKTAAGVAGKRPSILSSGLLITGFFALDVALRYLVQVAVAFRFGAGSMVDRYLAALAVPEVISLVLVTSAGVTLVPILVEYTAKEGEASAWRIATGFLNLSGLFLVALTLAGYLVAPWVIRLTVPGFSGGALASTIHLFRLLLPLAGLSTIVGGLNSIYYSRQSFFWPSLVLVLGTVTNLAFVVALAGRLSIDAVAIGLLASGALRIAALSPILLHRPYRLNLELNHPGLRRVLVLMAPLVVGTLFAQANTIFDRLVGSWLPEGSISYLGYAYRMLLIVSNLATTGLSTAVFPVMAAMAASQRRDEQATLTMRSFMAALYIVIPSITFLAFFASEAIGILLQRGRFDQAATFATATAIYYYLGAALFVGTKTPLAYSLYARQRQLAVAILGMATMVVNIGLNFWLARLLGYRGIALAHSIAIPLSALALLLLLKRELPSLQIAPVLGRFVLLLGMSLGLWWLVSWGYGAFWPVGSTLLRLVKLALAFGLGGMVYALLTLALRLPEALYLTGRLRARFAFLPGGSRATAGRV